MSGRRHSEQDMAHIRSSRSFARRIMKAMQALGDDGLPALAAKAVQIDPDAHPGAMICLMLSPEQQQTLRDAARMPEAEADHVTLLYLAPDAQALALQKNQVLTELAEIATAAAPLAGTIGGVARFAASESSDGQDVCVALYDCAALPGLRETLVMCLTRCGIAYAADHGFTPHITLGYLAPGTPMPVEQLSRAPLDFAAISLIWGGERVDLPLLLDTQAQYAGETMEDWDDGLGAPPPSPEAVERARAQFAATLGIDAADISQAIAEGDTLVYAGGPIKALGGGRVGGFGVQFAPGRDLTDEYFTAKTFLGRNDGDGQDTYFHHAIPIEGLDELATRTFAPAKAERRDLGIWVEAVLNMADDYEKVVYSLAEQGKLGWSSGAAGHLVRKSRDGEIIRWPVVEWSLTPSPAEPRNRVMALKTLPPVVIDVAPQAAGDAATGTQTAAPVLQTIYRGDSTKMADNEEEVAASPPLDMVALKAVFGEVLDTRLAAAEQRINAGINDRLKAIEDSPALKSAGYISDGTHLGDKETKSFGDFALCIRQGNTRRLRTHYKSTYADVGADGEFKALNEESGGTGGYTVPVEYEPSISKIAGQMAIIEPLAFPVQMGSAEKKIPMLKQTENATSSGVGSSGFFGGMYFTLESDGTDIEEREPEFALMTLHARKLAGLTIASNELREDSATIESELLGIFGEGLALAKDYLHLLGNGVGKPLGMLSASNPARLIVGRLASGDDIEITDVTTLMSKMIPSLFGSGIFLAHPTAIKFLMRLQLVTNGDAAFVAADNAPEGSPLIGRLINRPVYSSEFMAVPSSSATGDLAFVAPRAYAVGTRRGILIAGSEHYRFNRDQYTWRITSRGDGQPRLDGTVKLHDGSNTEVSAFCVLGP